MKTHNILQHYSTEDASKRSVVGIWDFSSSPFKLGNCLLFNQNLFLLKKQLGADTLRLIIYANPNETFINSRINSDNFRTYIQQVLHYFLLFDCIDSFLIYTNEEDFHHAIESSKEQAVFFPPSFSNRDIQYDYKSYLMNQEYLELNASLPFSQINAQQRKEAKTFLSQFKESNIVSVHLRFDASFRVNSNALLREWIQFFTICSDKYPHSRFVLIGNDVFPNEDEAQLRQLPNISFSKEHGLTILQELALIQESNAFMGIASGPSNAAILNTKPYMIIKHEEDAWAEKFDEVVDLTKFPFAYQHQYFKITTETTELLLSFFQEIQ